MNLGKYLIHMKLDWINSPPINQDFVHKGMSVQRESASWYLHGWAQPQNFSFSRSSLGLKLDLFNFLTSFRVLLALLGFPGGTSGKKPTCQCRRLKKLEFNPWVRKIPWSRKQHPTPVFLSGKSHGQRSLVGYSPRVRKEPDTTEHAHMQY